MQTQMIKDIYRDLKVSTKRPIKNKRKVKKINAKENERIKEIQKRTNKKQIVREQIQMQIQK